MSEREVSVLFGAPGTGKTTFLINKVEEAIRKGTPPERIAYLAFSRKAAREAASRAMAQFHLAEEELPWFRTVHSAAYKMLDLKPSDVMCSHHYKELGKAIGVTFAGTYDHRTERPPLDLRNLGDKCLMLYARAKARKWPLEQEWRSSQQYDLPWHVVSRFASNLNAYKRDRCILDFTDMIDQVEESLNVDIMIIDEAQDLTPQQWTAARKLGATAQTIYLAGDDDQAIYTFSGATVDPLLTVRARRVVLPHSYRLPANVKALADRIATRIKRRAPKQFTSKESVGLVTWLREADNADLTQGTWLLLCRNRSQLDKLESIARRQNVVYYRDGLWSNCADSVRAVVIYEKLRRGEKITGSDLFLVRAYIPAMKIPSEKLDGFSWTDILWPFPGKPTWMEALLLSPEDREYIRGLRRRNESLTKPGRVVISTVHGAKGGEADNVLLLTDISGRVARGAIERPDDEWRVVYVGVSRAKEALYIVNPTTTNFWSIQ